MAIRRDAALGKSFFTLDDPKDPDNLVRVTIVGVVADFIFEGDRRKIVPTVYAFDPDNSAIDLGEGACRTAWPRRLPPSTASGTPSSLPSLSAGIF